MKKRALICGISGQDGTYLAQLLLNKDYEVVGTSRDAHMTSFSGLQLLGIKEQVKVESMAMNDFRSVLQVIKKVQPHELYNLAGQSSVSLSFQQPVETLDSIVGGTLNILEAIRFIGEPVRFYNAGSGECFGDTKEKIADENTPFRPKSPYAVAKATAFWQVDNYREAYHIHACSGILFNHESPLRPERFVTKKIVAAACRIAAGSKEKLKLGNLNVSRDWGWAPEYIQAMWLMLQQNIPDDFIIATGETRKLEDFVTVAFEEVGLRWADHVEFDKGLFRPSDIPVSCGNPRKAADVLHWQAQKKMKQVVASLIKAEKNKSV